MLFRSQHSTQTQQQAQGELQRLNGRLASLEALQQAALDPGKGVGEWLREQQLSERPRLAEGLRVAAGWELAVETVLGADLHAVMLDDYQGLEFTGLTQGDLRLVSPSKGAAQWVGSLLDKVSAEVDLSPWLGKVKPVQNLDEALDRKSVV